MLSEANSHLKPENEAAVCPLDGPEVTFTPEATLTVTPDLRAPLCYIGVSHETAPSEVREKVALTTEQIEAALKQSPNHGLTECVILSTCNRTEVYFSGGSPTAAMTFLAEVAGSNLPELRPFIKVGYCSQAAEHLFRVTAGLESAVLGESEIVAQVKEAWKTAQLAGSNGQLTDLIFRRSLEAGKRARTETELCRSSVSTATLAVRQLSHHLGELSDSSISVIGAGAIARRLAKELVSAGVQNVTILNRTVKNAEELASEIGVKSTGLDQLHETLHASDAVISAVEVTEPILGRDALHSVQKSRNFRQLIVIDMGVPANVARDTVEGVLRVDIDELTATSEANAELRNQAIPHAEAVLEEELLRFNTALGELAAKPTIKALVKRADLIRFKHVEWAKERLPDLTEKELRVVEEMARRMMNAVLQAPIEGLKSELGAPANQDLAAKLLGLVGVPNDAE